MKKTSSQTSLPNLKPASSTDSIKSTTSLKTSKQSEKQPLDKQLSLPTIQPLKKKRDKKQNDIQNTDTEQQISEVIKSTHERIKGNLKSRLKYLQMIKQDWDTGIEGNRGITQAIQTMAKINDCSVWKDVLKIVNTTPKLVSDLDTCLVLLPVLRDLLFEGKDSGIVIAAETIRALLKMFSSVILENLNTLKRNVDLVAEEREKKCRACFDGFFEIKGMLYELRGPGRVGAAVDECMRDLAVFSV